MSKAQRRIILLAVVACFLMVLFPPWKFALIGLNGKSMKPTAGWYAFVGSPPTPREAAKLWRSDGGWASVELDLTRLLVQLGVVAVVAGTALVLTKSE